MTLPNLTVEEVEMRFASDEPNSGEALGIAWTNLHGLVKGGDGEMHAIQINVTSRSYVGPGDALDKLMAAIEHAKETHNLRPYAPSFKLPSPKEPEKSTAAESGTPAPAAGPTVPPQEGELHCRINRIGVTPREDERADLKFFDNDPAHKYPVLSISNWKIASLLEMLPKGWSEKAFAVVKTFNVSYDVFYTLSEKKTEKGNPFKDVTRIVEVS